MKTKITRVELKRIYDIACQSWQPKIEKYAQRNPFGDEIEFSEKEIKEMISACTSEQLPIVKEIFNVTNIWENIKSVNDAIKYLGDSDEEVKILKQLQECSLPRHIIAEQELVVVIKAVNDKWVADYNNYSQCKYYSWWYLGEDFRLLVVICGYSSSSVSSRLVLETREKAEYLSREFKNLYKDYMNK